MGIRNPSQYRIPAFRSFEQFLFEWLAIRKLEELDLVFQPQYRFVCDDNQQVITDYIGKVETLAEDARVVGDRLRKDLNIGHANRTGDGSAYVRQFHSQDMVDLIAERYATDIALFNYSFGT